MPQLAPHDLRYVAQRLPRDVRDLLKAHGSRLMVGGGFIRAAIAGEVASDIDMFGDDADWLGTVANALVSVRPGAKIHRTKNAITVLTPDRMPVQFITRWTFGTPTLCVASFDFTVCQAVVYRTLWSNGDWHSAIGDRFYQDLAARRLHYTSPVREEEAGGSMLRVLKYTKRGYSIQVGSLAAVIGRCTAGAIDDYDIASRLREVDPLLVIDGFEIVDDHAPIEDLDLQTGA